MMHAPMNKKNSIGGYSLLFTLFSSIEYKDSFWDVFLAYYFSKLFLLEVQICEADVKQVT